MQKLCLYLNFECADYWSNRYQTLIVGLVAVLIAFRQSVIARDQRRISERQLKMTEDQNSQAKALAKLKVDRALRTVEHLSHLMVTRGMHTDLGQDANGRQLFDWSPSSTLPLFDKVELDSDTAEVEEAAVRAFPDQASDIGQLLIAAKKLKSMAADFASNPWERIPGPNGLDPRQAVMNSAFNDLWNYSQQLHSILPRNR